MLRQSKATIALSLILVVSLFAQACNKTTYGRTVNRATQSLTLALQVVHSSYQAGAVSKENHDLAFKIGYEVNGVLNEANEFAAQLPPGEFSPKFPATIQQKRQALAIIVKGTAAVGRLAAQSKMFQSTDQQQSFVGYVRDVQAMLSLLQSVVDAWPTK